MDSSIISFHFWNDLSPVIRGRFFFGFFFLSVVIGDGLFLSYFLYKYALFCIKKHLLPKKCQILGIFWYNK